MGGALSDAAGGERRKCATVKCAFKSDDAKFLGVTIRRMIFARHFDRTFKRLRTRIGKEDRISKTMLDKAACESFAFRNLIKI